MTTTTKAVAWIGAIFGAVSLLVLALIIGAMMYAGYKNLEQQRQQQQAADSVEARFSTGSPKPVKDGD